MKKYLLILICATVLIPFAGCKKDSFDPTGKSQNDFIGTWNGSISTFKNNKLVIEYCTVEIYPDAGGTYLSGIIFMQETNVFHEFQFIDGTLYFNVVNNDPSNPFCQAWSLGGYAVFKAESEIELNISGNECGDLGDEFISWSGALKSSQLSSDSLKYYNFAKNGNKWTYSVTLLNGTTCQVEKQINLVPSDYLFSGLIAQTCGWAGQNASFSWNVTPDAFSVITDSTLSNKPFTLPINAKPGVIYRTYVNNDTTTVTLVDTSQILSTPAGIFPCWKFKYTEPVYFGSNKVTRTAYLWLNSAYGIIRQEVSNPVNSTDVITQVISSKNF